MTDDQQRLFNLMWPHYQKIEYRWGGNNPSDGLDCSGLVIEFLQSFGALPGSFDTTALGLWRKVGIKVTEPQIGDLVFYGASEPTISHVGICLTPTTMLEAGGGSRSMTKPGSGIAGNGRVRVRPIHARKDVIGFKRPDYAF